MRQILKTYLDFPLKLKISGLVIKQKNPKIQNQKLTAHYSIPFHLKAAIRSNPWARLPKTVKLELRFLTQTLQRVVSALYPFSGGQLRCKSRTESLPWNKEELQISKEENHKERSLFLLPEWRAAKGVSSCL